MTGQRSHALTTRAAACEEDGTGRWTPIVTQGGVFDGVVAFKPGQSEAAGGTFVTNEFSPTVQAQNNGSTAVPAVAFTHSGYSNKPAWITGDCTDCLPSSGHGDTSHQEIGVIQPLAVRTAQTSANGHGVAEGVCHTLDQVQGQAVMMPMAVRRLTPRECERLQGFPDDYTAIECRKKPAADGPKYRALGNSMAVPCMWWLGMRIAQATHPHSSEIHPCH